MVGLSRLTNASPIFDDRTRRVGLAALAGVVQRATGILATFLIFPRVLHAIGPDQFGIWGAATSLIFLIVIADFGIGPAIMTLVPRALASGSATQPREFFAAAMAMAWIIAGLVAVLGALLALTLAPRPELIPYLLAIGGLALNVPLGIANPAWMALQRGWMVAFWDFVQTVVLVGGLAVATHVTTDVRVYVIAVYGALLTANGLNLAFLLWRHPEIRPTDSRSFFRNVGTMARTGTKYFALSGLDALSYMLDNVLALQLLGAAASAKMAIVQKICISSLGLVTVLIQPLWPAFVDAAARGDRRWLFGALGRGSALVAAAATLGSALLVALGLPFLRLWLKTDVGFDQATLWVIAGWIVSLSLVRVQIMLLNALQIVRFQIAVFALATTVALCLKFVLAPRLGVAGILVATAVTFPVIILPAVLWRTNRWRLSTPSADRERGPAPLH